MKKLSKWMFAAMMMICGSVLTLTSCGDDDNFVNGNDNGSGGDDASTLADVTILYYAHGGGNLDVNYIGNLRALYGAEASSYENVKIAVEYKFSKEDNLPTMASEAEISDMDELVRTGGKSADAEISNKNYLRWMSPKGSSTLRFVLDPSKTLKEQAADSYLSNANLDITKPESLTEFINWAAKACPAKRYVLILNDHGGGYTPDAEIYSNNDVKGKGVIFDDAYKGKHFSAPSLAYALKSADIRPNVLYFDACLMNTLEYMFELKDVTDYIVASTYVTLAGAPYSTLIDVLSKAADTPKYALEKYIEYYVKNFDPQNEDEVFYYDMTVTETAKLDQLGRSMKEFVNRLCDTYQNGTAEQKQKIDGVTAKAVKINKGRALYDVGRYVEGMREALPEVFDDTFYAELEASFNNCIVAQYYSKYLLKHNYEVDYSVLLAQEGTYLELDWKDSGNDSKILTYLTEYKADGNFTVYSVENGEFKNGVTPKYTLKFEYEAPWGGTLASVYGALAFDKATNWSRWLLLNKQQPSLWCNNEFETPLPKISEE